jgi:ABC-type branched-subunit amino acid transport system substrate-binding protein
VKSTTKGYLEHFTYGPKAFGEEAMRSAIRGRLLKAKSVERSDVVKAMNDTEFDTVIGELRFNEKVDPNLSPYTVYRWSNATYEEID